jgi:hypothetical protein
MHGTKSLKFVENKFKFKFGHLHFFEVRNVQSLAVCTELVTDNDACICVDLLICPINKQKVFNGVWTV